MNPFVYRSTPDSRLLLHSNPTPPEPDQPLKKSCTMSSQGYIPPSPVYAQTGRPLQNQQYLSPSPMATTYAFNAVETALHEELQTTITNIIKQEVDIALKNAFHTYTEEIDQLRNENIKLRNDLDALEQYGRRELMQFSGINEDKYEDTTAIVTKIVKAIDTDFSTGDIIRSHRVGNSVRKDRQGRTLPPRHIIVRVKDPLTKNPDYQNVLINEYLTKMRSTVAYKARQLKNKGFVKQSWTVDGKVFLKDNRTEFSLRAL